VFQVLQFREFDKQHRTRRQVLPSALLHFSIAEMSILWSHGSDNRKHFTVSETKQKGREQTATSLVGGREHCIFRFFRTYSGLFKRGIRQERQKKEEEEKKRCAVTNTAFNIGAKTYCSEDYQSVPARPSCVLNVGWRKWKRWEVMLVNWWEVYCFG